MGEVGIFGAVGKSVYNAVNILRCQLIVVGHLDALAGGVDKQGFVVRLVLFQHHNAGSDAGAKEQVAGQLDDAVDEVVIDEILADFLLRPAPVQDAGKTHDSGGAVGRQPAEAVHDESQIRLALGSQHTSGREAGVVDEKRVGVPRPFNGVWRIGDDQLKGLVIPMLWIGQGILAGNAKLVKTDVVEKHIDAAQVVRGDIDFLSKKAVAYCIVAQHLHRFQQQGTRTTSGIYVPTDFDTKRKALSRANAAEKGLK